MLEFEEQAWAKGYGRLAGIDEAGRGPLAGPVIAAAVVFDREFLRSEQNGLLAGLTDSKALSQGKREAFHALLTSSPGVAFGVGCAQRDEIDRINILRATHEAMSRAVAQLAVQPDHALVDGLDIPALPCSATAIVRGDALSMSIAAASVIAKVVRDAMMQDLDRLHPGYGFAKHKGYGTAAHVRALFALGPSPEHRRSFQPVRDAERILALRRQEELGNERRRSICD